LGLALGLGALALGPLSCGPATEDEDPGGLGAACTSDGDCSPELCHAGHCGQRCYLDLDCAAYGGGWRCDGTGHCVAGDAEEPDLGPDGGGPADPDLGPAPPLRCDPPCTGNRVCDRGRCVDRCQAPLPCPADETRRVADVEVDAYEASRPDASETEVGCNASRACSAAGRVPWTNVSWAGAEAACAAAGKRLCRDAEWRRACAGPQGLRYPYGESFDPSACNVAAAGLGAVWPTGGQETCRSAEGVFDLPGNVAEWLGDELAPRQRATVGGSVLSNSSQSTCDYAASNEADSTRQALIGFRCCRDVEL